MFLIKHVVFLRKRQTENGEELNQELSLGRVLGDDNINDTHKIDFNLSKLVKLCSY